MYINGRMPVMCVPINFVEILYYYIYIYVRRRRVSYMDTAMSTIDHRGGQQVDREMNIIQVGRDTIFRIFLDFFRKHIHLWNHQIKNANANISVNDKTNITIIAAIIKVLVYYSSNILKVMICNIHETVKRNVNNAYLCLYCKIRVIKEV